MILVGYFSFFFLFLIVGGDEVLGLGLRFGCDLYMAHYSY